jgi:hypothetical protein
MTGPSLRTAPGDGQTGGGVAMRISSLGLEGEPHFRALIHPLLEQSRYRVPFQKVQLCRDVRIRHRLR